MPDVIFEFYGTARLRAGTSSVTLQVSSIGEALETLAAQFPTLQGSVISNSRVSRFYKLSLNGDRFVDDPATPLRDGDTLIILSADAGG